MTILLKNVKIPVEYRAQEESSDLGIIVDTDMITAKIGGEKIAGGKEAVRIISDCLERGLNFTQETTLSGQRTLRTIISARERDYYIRLYYVGVGSADESLLRISNRVKKGGHDIPADDVIILIPNQPDIGEYRNGEIIIGSEYVPEWMTGFRKYLRVKQYKG